MDTQPIENPWRIIAGAAVFLALAAFFWTTQSILSPFLMGGCLLFLLAGLKSYAFARRLSAVVVIILFVWFFVNAKGVVFPLIVAFVLAYLFDPVVDLMEKIRIRRSLATFFLLFVTLGLIVLFGIILIPSLVVEIQELIKGVPSLGRNVFDFIQENLPRIMSFFRIDAEEFQQRLLDEFPARMQTVLSSVLSGVTGIGTFLSQIFNVVLIPVLTFYILKDFNRIRDWAMDMIPRRHKGSAYFYHWRLNRIIGGYFRGQIIVCTIVGILTGVGFALFKLPFAILIGFLTGVLNIIPVIGLYVSLMLSLLTGFLMPEVVPAMLKIAGVFIVVQILDGYVIQPKIVGERVGLHPVAVIISVLAFSRFLGFWGLIIGVPTAALLKFLIDEWKRRQDWRELMEQKAYAEHTKGE